MQQAPATPDTDPAAEAPAPRVHTLLLTDLCDSVALVERLGDTAAAELFQEHDRLVLRLQQQWKGRMIDRSDGLLLLFERPVNGLGFALDYRQGLEQLGKLRGIDLQARTGMHVGEVLTWHNSVEAVQAGAKPLEVEGLAKPLAARLMALARPGQILLSAVAESLAHRSARELGARSGHLLWKSHGRWHFKGVPTTQEVFEVGEPGFAPLRTPRSTPKAWRDLPFWRRPMALVAEAALLAALCVGAWFFMRPEPAIAFAERDWVVMGDLRNLTGNALLDDSVMQALRVSLEQSRHVNVLSDMKTRDTLSRMRRDPVASRLDRTLASEVALRDGARLVILPAVSEVGGKLRLSMEIVDPHTQATIRSDFVDGRGLDSLLASVDAIASRLRGHLGETRASVKAASQPLPSVTTSNLHALRAYALGLQATREGKWQQAMQMYNEATTLDPEFALGYLGAARVMVARSQRPSAMPFLDRALALRHRLPDRERLYLDAWEAELRAPVQALEKWQLMAGLYPDDFAGQANSAWHLFTVNRMDEALPYAQAADVPQDPLRPLAADFLARVLLAKGAAEPALKRLREIGNETQAGQGRRIANVLAVLERPVEAMAALEAIRPSGYAATDLVPMIDRVSLALDQGRWEQARAAVENAVETSGQQDAFMNLQFRFISSVVAQTAGVSLPRSRRLATAQALVSAIADPAWDPSNRADLTSMLLANAWLAQREGDTSLAANALRQVDALPDKERLGTTTAAMQRIVQAGQLAANGRHDEASRLLSPRADDLYQSRVALYRVLAAAGRHAEAETQARWLLKQRGLAYIEANASQALQPLNVADSRLARLWLAESLAAQGKHSQATAEMQAFLRQWPASVLSPQLLSRAEAILSASKQKTTA
ncbi:putative peptide modification system cyclase [Stenotrophomonas acidaminiphila]|uniref:putative peptide modification system cyclase n=1 Tax=Stenotrophomonas acidaminiphila TaxID=128780 RepID=UPI001E146AB9|nr:putative peptide modification system cyclase [Stenotrophomonas acidaminiphila]MPS33920.1 putative peptide modification system cyclase [Stenotrophomonas sp.]